MASNQDEDMYLFDQNFGSTPAAFPGQSFDDLLPPTPASRSASDAGPAFLNPSDLIVKKEPEEQGRVTARRVNGTSYLPGSDTSSSSSNSPYQHARSVSGNDSATPSVQSRQAGTWGSGINGLTMPSGGDDLFADTEMHGMSNRFDAEYEASNQQMATDFDFETAASTPSGYVDAGFSDLNGARPDQLRAVPAFNTLGHNQSASPHLAAAQAKFQFGESREGSPLNAMLPAQGNSPWTKHSPSSGLEDTFNGITMNGDSPGNAIFSPTMQFGSNGFSYEPESSATPSTFAKDISSPPSTVNSADGRPTLYIYPTSLKSRVETQIPIKMTLSPLPAGATRLRLPTHTVSKPKFLAKPEADRTSDTLELYTSLVCTSAMQDPVKLDRAFAHARGEDSGTSARPSPASSSTSHSSRDIESDPLNGGEVRICSGCIQRERKRASRKKQKKPDEDDLFQKDEEKRVVVFNTNEIKEWAEPAKDGPTVVPGLSTGAQPPHPPGAMQVELPMRIACYCRHQNEKLGFQVIFTIKDHSEKVIAQAMTNSIMITDDHKTHNAPATLSTSSNGLPSAPPLPGAGVFSSSGAEMGDQTSKLFKSSFSTTDLHGLQHNFNPNFPMTPTGNPFAIPSGVSSNTSATLTPRNLSRPASPNGLVGPTTNVGNRVALAKFPPI